MMISNEFIRDLKNSQDTKEILRKLKLQENEEERLLPVSTEISGGSY